MDMQKTLVLILEAWRRFDDENDLAAFEDRLEAAALIADIVPSYCLMDVIIALFGKEAEGDAEGDLSVQP